jgi:oxygen-independent coproporphyrinogen-3 oxidase
MPRHVWAAPAPADTLCFPPEQCFEAGERNHHISNTAYPIAHSATWGAYRIPRAGQRAAVLNAFDGIDDLCLYVHIPFCEVRCAFCEYTVVGKSELAQTEDYMRRLNSELVLYRDLLDTPARTLHGFDIGGGTPAFVAAEYIAELVDNVRSSFRMIPGLCISIETTPRLAAAEPHKLEAYVQAGIQRISMGIQVIQPDLLRVLNRAGNGVEHHFKAVENIRRAGFRKFNVDLMYGFADQTLDSWRATLEHAIRLTPDYITLYRMRYKLTRISDQASRVEIATVRTQLAFAKTVLADASYHANPGKTTYSRLPGDNGTSDYITRRVVDGMPYLGLGLGAQTLSHTTISYNDGAAGKNLAPYIKSVDAGRLPIQDLYDLPRAHMMAKMICVSFYFGEIDMRGWHDKFGQTLADAFPAEVDFVLQHGLMEYTERALRLTPKGAKHFNGVVALFHAPSVKQYLINRDPATAEDMHHNQRRALTVAHQTGAERPVM